MFGILTLFLRTRIRINFEDLCKHNSCQVCLTHKTDFVLFLFVLEGYTKVVTGPLDLLLNLLMNVIDPRSQDCLIPTKKYKFVNYLNFLFFPDFLPVLLCMVFSLVLLLYRRLKSNLDNMFFSF